MGRRSEECFISAGFKDKLTSTAPVSTHALTWIARPTVMFCMALNILT